jgi:succinyl-diaminopimelate desuccinylase
MASGTLNLSKKLIACRTDPTNKSELHRALLLVEDELKGFHIERFERNGYLSILVSNTRHRPKRFKVLLNGHLDVIPGKDFQYTPKVVGRRLYGVGSMDMKSNVACLIQAFKESARSVSYPLGLQIVTDEEIGGFDGTMYQVERGVRADFVIAGETTQFDIVNEAKGVLWLKISCRGKTAHGAYPWRGENAIVKMNRCLEMLLKEFPVPAKQAWTTTMNISRIETSNQSFNKVPDTCTAFIDVRFVPSESRTILKRFRAALPKGFRVEVVAHEPALYVDKKNPYLTQLRKISERVTRRSVKFYGAQGSSDARHFTRVGCAGVEFGPIGKGIGTDDEWVSIPSLADYERILREFLLSLDV